MNPENPTHTPEAWCERRKEFEEYADMCATHTVLSEFPVHAGAIQTPLSHELAPTPRIYFREPQHNFSYCPDAVFNLKKAVERGCVRVEREGEDVVIELLPIDPASLPPELAHVAELPVLRKHLAGQSWGDAKTCTYLQSTRFGVEGGHELMHFDREEKPKRYGRIYVDTAKLSSTHRVYIDPESIHITEGDFGESFFVFGSVPTSALSRVQIMQTNPHYRAGYPLEPFFPTPEEVEAQRVVLDKELGSFLQTRGEVLELFTNPQECLDLYTVLPQLQPEGV